MLTCAMSSGPRCLFLKLLVDIRQGLKATYFTKEFLDADAAVRYSLAVSHMPKPDHSCCAAMASIASVMATHAQQLLHLVHECIRQSQPKSSALLWPSRQHSHMWQAEVTQEHMQLQDLECIPICSSSLLLQLCCIKMWGLQLSRWGWTISPLRKRPDENNSALCGRSPTHSFVLTVYGNAFMIIRPQMTASHGVATTGNSMQEQFPVQQLYLCVPSTSIAQLSSWNMRWLSILLFYECHARCCPQLGSCAQQGKSQA